MTERALDIAHLTPEKRRLLARLLREKGEDFNTFPLSFSQERLWFLDRLQPDDPFYNIPFAFRVSGRLSAAVLTRTFRRIVQRHEVLRTRFPALEGRPMVAIEPRPCDAVAQVDLSALEPGSRRSELDRLLRREARRPFDLAHGPLLRVLLIELGAEEQVFFINLHHIVADAWSLEVLTREVRSLYDAYATRRPPPVAELPIQYADFALWQRRWLGEEAMQEQLAYWREQLSGAPPLLELPTDRPRPSVQSYLGAMVSFRLPEPVAAALIELGRRSGATLFMTLLAGFQAFLHRITGQRDLVVGSPVANRTRPEVQDLIGFLVNMLVLRVDLTAVRHPRPSFRELLTRVRSVALGAFAHQDLPFEMLVEELAPRRNLSYSPFFQTMFMLQPGIRRLETCDGVMTPLTLETGTARFDLTLSMMEQDGKLSGTFEYSTELFDGTTVQRLAEQLETLLAALAADPDRALDRLPLLGPRQHHQLLFEWNDTVTDYPAMPIHRLIEQQAARSPTATALIFEAERLTYRQLDRRANRLAHHLVGLGVGPEKVVGISIERGLDMVVGLLGILKAGGAYLPLDPSYPQDRLRFMMEDAGVSVWVTRLGSQAALPPTSATVVCLSGDREAIDRCAETPPDVEPAVDNLAYLIYTSGSTGQPKGVMVRHRNVANFFAAMDQRLDPEPPATWLAVTGISFDISVLELLWTLARGLRTVVQGESPAAAVRIGGEAARSSRGIQLSLFYFAADGEVEGDPYRLLFEGARFADRNGFTAVWTPERHFHAFGGLYPNPSVTSAALAAMTERIQIRAGSVVLPLHHPVRVAEEWSLVDNFSNGRVAISFASGWHADDFIFAPESYADRRSVMFRDIEVVRRLWRGESVSLPGGAGQAVEVKIHPRPVQAELPTWVTAGGSPETFRAAGEAGANLLTHLLGQSVEQVADKIGVYRQAWREHGHPGAGHVTLMLHTFVGRDLDAVRELVRQPFTDYLRTSAGLMRNLARGLDLNFDELAAEEMETLLDHAFERYFETSGLMGTPDSCLNMIERLKRIEVDEVACLVDFGIDADVVLAGLEDLAEVRRSANRPSAASLEDYMIARQLTRHDVSHLQSTPSMAAMLVADPETASSLRTLDMLLLGGEALPPALLEQLGRFTDAEIRNMYGPTETTIWSATARVSAAPGPVSIGGPIANTGIYVLDRALRPVPCGSPGQLFIGGDGVTRGYRGAPAQTAAAFIPDPFGAPGNRLYATGDLARHRPAGDLEFLGRLDHQLKVRGHRIEPGEVEAALRRHAGVREAVVVGREDLTGDRQLVAYVVASQGGTATLQVQVSPEDRQRLLSGHRSFDLPNGMTVAQHDGRQARVLYEEVFADQVYLRHGITFADGDCIFDVGANTGFFTLFARQVCKPSKIYAFEPIPANCALLRVNAALYGIDVEVLDCGVAESSGSAEFIFYPNAAGLSGRSSELGSDMAELQTFARHGLETELAGSGERAGLGEQEIEAALEEHLRSETYTCRLTSISQVIEEFDVERIDLLKLDVEKSEVRALEGIRDADWLKIRQIVIEVHGKDLLAQTTAILEARGFTVEVDELVGIEGATGEESDIYAYMLYGRRPSGEAPAAGPVLSFSELRASLRGRLPEYMVPSIFVPLDALPLTPNGKVDRAALPAPDLARRASDLEYVSPKDPTERRIAGIWQDVLRVETVSRNDNFFEVGGTSLLLVQVHQQVKQASEREVSLVDMFRHPTVASMAELLGGNQRETAAVKRSRERAEKHSEVLQTSATLDRQREFLARRRRRKKAEAPEGHG